MPGSSGHFCSASRSTNSVDFAARGLGAELRYLRARLPGRCRGDRFPAPEHLATVTSLGGVAATVCMALLTPRRRKTKSPADRGHGAGRAVRPQRLAAEAIEVTGPGAVAAATRDDARQPRRFRDRKRCLRNPAPFGAASRSRQPDIRLARRRGLLCLFPVANSRRFSPLKIGTCVARPWHLTCRPVAPASATSRTTTGR